MRSVADCAECVSESAAFEIQRILLCAANWAQGSNCSNNYDSHTRIHAHTHTRVHCLIKMHCLLLRALSSYAIAKRRNYLCAAYCVCNLYAYNARTHTHAHRVAFAYSFTPLSSLFGLLTPPLFMLHISCISFVLPTYQASCPATRTPHTARPQPDPPHPHARPRPQPN